MKKIALIIAIFIIAATFARAGGNRDKAPIVRYIEPKSDSVIDLTGKENLVFKWKSNPIPGGGRLAYKFDLYKGFGYEVVIGEKLEHDVFSVEVPGDIFENGATYTWQVKQRDARTRFWSMDNRWSFKVEK